MADWIPSPDVRIEFCGDKYRVSVPGQTGYIDVYDAAALNLLLPSAFPETLENALGEPVPECGSDRYGESVDDAAGVTFDSDLNRTLFRYFNAFRQIGALLPAPNPQTAVKRSISNEPHRPGFSAEVGSLLQAVMIAGRGRLYRLFGRNRREIRTILRSMSRDLRRIGGDAEAFGPGLDGEFRLIWRLTRCLKELNRVTAEMRTRQKGYVDTQLRRIGLTREITGLKLHLGSGPHVLEGWINIDCYPAQLQMDLNWGLPFIDGSADYVFLSHTLEHFYYPGEALAIFKEIRRVLARAGRVRIVVPDIGKCFKAYAKDDDDFFESRRRVWTWWPTGRTRLGEILAYAGVGASAEVGSHKYGYDFATLRSLLIQAGFAVVEQSEFMQSKDPVLRLDSASLVAGATFGGGYYSLFVEATA
jgi:predicted SAM-dependent methyltransferase